MTSTTLERILALSDAGSHPADIATALSVSPSYVYTILREHRPDRERKPRACTSNKPDQIRALFKVNKNAARTAKLLKCSRAYVYRHIEGMREK